MKPTDRCRCGCPRLAHTGAWGMATACTGSCGCSFFEDARYPKREDRPRSWPIPIAYFYGPI